MIKSTESPNKTLLLIGLSVFILWMGLGASFCYEMGRDGIENINWLKILTNNIPVIIIALGFVLASLKKIGTHSGGACF
jgi:hypothetical protein